ncbi:uroporphyrinogen-III C-methyltransferase [Nakamurella sp. A5-74]|uniref:uroporphyrinogen-III C-methyltransferase n=1 Tax=Nakamurella sp. A5-74 TaxID=3158264 RepID=A0AAU8DSC0_9ACTN
MTTLLGIDLRGRPVLVTGGGPVAARRVTAMVRAGALVRVVSPWMCEDILDLHAEHPDAVQLHHREVAESDVDDVWLVHGATGDPATNLQLAGWATERRVFCTNGGAADRGTARTPAVTRSGEVVIGVVSGGDTAGSSHADPRRATVLRDRIADLLAEGELDLRRHRPGAGRVVLVGGGPGAEDLMTVRGRRALAEADVVVTDRLGPSSLVQRLRPGVEVIDVGKAPDHHPVPQQRINEILVEHARRGRVVVRLKGGDPFVFGRGGEEVIACREAGVEVSVVPGISSALAAPALAGIPITQRGLSTSFHVTTGHGGLDPAATAVVGLPGSVLVVLMGVSALGLIAEQAAAAGAPADTPIAVVENGSTPQQRIVRGTLGTIRAIARQRAIAAPAVIVIGAVAAPDVLGPSPETAAG